MTTSHNRALWRAAHSLTHPVIVAAVIGLLINDHWLRHAHPSWLTGKLGDFTWLIFAPLIAAIFFAVVIPRRVRHHTRIVGWLSFASVGLWFATAKTIPAAHALTTAAWSTLVGWQGSLRLDPTDLLALPGLLIVAWVWSHAEDSPLNLRPLAYVIAALGLVGTLASDEPTYTDPGIICLSQQDNLLITESSFTSWYTYDTTDNNRVQHVSWHRYTSQDGGLSWGMEIVQDENSSDYLRCSRMTHLAQPDNPDIQYRWQPAEFIEGSVDGGQTWALEYDLVELRQEVRMLYNHAPGPYRTFEPGPFTGIIDSETGNLVLAMSWDGVLVRTPDGIWQWVDVGDYGLADIQNLDRLYSILFIEWWMAGALFFLVITTSTAYIRQRLIRLRRRRALMLGWIGWGIVFLGFGYGEITLYNAFTDIGDRWSALILAGLLSLALLVLAIPLSIGAVWDIARNFWRQAGHIFLSGFGVTMLYLFPLILWSQGTIPRYTTAIVFSLILTLAGLYATYKHLTRVLPVLPGRDPITEDSAPGDSD